MKKLSLLVSFVLVFALSVWAQTPSTNDTQSGTNPSASPSQSYPSQGSQPSTSPSNTQGSQTGNAPSASQDTSGSQTTGSQGSSQSTMGQGNMGTAEQGKMGKEQKLKGCLESENGTYELREKGGKEVVLTGSSDLSQYVKHEVLVHGNWATGAAASTSDMSKSSTSDISKSSGSEKQFTVSKVDSISDTCKGGKKSEKEKGAGSNTNPSGPQ